MPAEAVLHRVLADETAAAVSRHEIGAEDALLALASDRVQAALAVRELVARCLAALDSGRMEPARKIAAPIAREIFDALEGEARRV